MAGATEACGWTNTSVGCSLDMIAWWAGLTTWPPRVSCWIPQNGLRTNSVSTLMLAHYAVSKIQETTMIVVKNTSSEAYLLNKSKYL
jgi:hypothetical protein